MGGEGRGREEFFFFFAFFFSRVGGGAVLQWEKRDGGTEGRRRDFFTEEIETLKTDHVRSPRIKESDLAQQVRRDRHGTASATRPDEEPPGNSRKVARRTQPTCASTDVSTPSGPNVARDWEKFPCARTSHHVDELHRLAFSHRLGSPAPSRPRHTGFQPQSPHIWPPCPSCFGSGQLRQCALRFVVAIRWRRWALCSVMSIANSVLHRKS